MNTQHDIGINLENATGSGSQKPLRAEQLIWIFGHGRTGSTWLSQMMAELKNQGRWDEPYVGLLFGSLIYERLIDNDKLLNSPSFIMGEPYREVWLRSIRNFVLEGAAARYPELREDQYLVVKEPNGSIGAPLMMEALPESRMILLVRDPRDVVASYVDAKSEGGWNYESHKKAFLEGRRVAADKDPATFVRRHAMSYLKGISKAKKAYDAYQGYKALIKYEELRADTLGTMKRIYSELGLEVDEEALAKAVRKHSWENIPEEKKGEGKFRRKATPGGWREDLTPEQARVVEEVTAPLLEEFYPHKMQSDRHGTKIELQSATKPGSQKPLRAEQLIWIFGHGRTGGTWLSQMMAELKNQGRWTEPDVGLLFGSFIYEGSKIPNKLNNPRFIMGEPYREVWLRSIRNFVLEGAAARYPELREDQYLVVKETTGSIGAPLMMEALPESRIIFLIRDPRDVVASWKDARSEGGWSYERNKKLYLEGKRVPPDKAPVAFARQRAMSYLKKISKAKEAYDAHQGYKALIKYEELRADTLGTMKRIYSELGLEVDEEALAKAVRKHSWENIPEEKKGEGKFRRKATPGGWREDLTPEQARVVEEVTAPLLEEFYPHKMQSDRHGTKIELQSATKPGSQKPLRAEQLIWIFGHGRTGSTWLSQMMAELKNQGRWNEPLVGLVFGSILYDKLKYNDKKLNSPDFIMGKPYREVWLRSIRSFMLEGTAARYPELREGQYLVVKEPSGSIGAPLMMEALPESRMILLVRDPRDVVASHLDARREGGWTYERNKKLYLEGKRVPPDKAPVAFVRQHARGYLKGISKAKEAYDAHQGYKALIKYEELRADTLGTMKRIYSELGLEVDEEALAKAVRKHSWENIPEEKKGEGKRRRKARPGGWREDLTPEQARVVEEVTAPLLEEFYPHKMQSDRHGTKIELQSATKPGSQKPLRAEQLIWIFGHGRTGSTWLSQMMAELKNQGRWNEPYVGLLFGSFIYERLIDSDNLLNNPSFIMGEPYREVWLRSIRNFVLEGAAARYPELREDQYLVVKEPSGSIGAPLMMEALPESRMILLVRDPRDVVASHLDARREGGWTYERNKKLYLEGKRVPPDKAPVAFVRRHAMSYLKGISKAKKAYDAYQGYKALIKYEELRADTLGTMKRIYSELGLEVDEEALAKAVRKHSWENIPEEKKGEGKFRRKATPGGWREDLTPEQARVVEEVTAPLLEEFYPHKMQSAKRL